MWREDGEIEGGGSQRFIYTTTHSRLESGQDKGSRQAGTHTQPVPDGSASWAMAWHSE